MVVRHDHIAFVDDDNGIDRFAELNDLVDVDTIAVLVPRQRTVWAVRSYIDSLETSIVPLCDLDSSVEGVDLDPHFVSHPGQRPVA